jgi:hypothetical protein
MPARFVGVVAVVVALIGSAAAARASMPGIAQLDADARATGNLKRLAIHIGDRIFKTEWPAQVTQVSANGVDGHVVIGVRISGTHFHERLTKAEFEQEVVRVTSLAFASAPSAEEVDVWVTVPLVIGKDVVVSGDLAVPTTRPVFTVSVRRGSDPLRDLAFWDEEWVHTAFKQGV